MAARLYDSTQTKPLMENGNGFLLPGNVPSVILSTLLLLTPSCTLLEENPITTVIIITAQNVIKNFVESFVMKTPYMVNNNLLLWAGTVPDVNTFGWTHHKKNRSLHKVLCLHSPRIAS